VKCEPVNDQFVAARTVQNSSPGIRKRYMHFISHRSSSSRSLHSKIQVTCLTDLSTTRVKLYVIAPQFLG
jgi:hypothetical protein